MMGNRLDRTHLPIEQRYGIPIYLKNTNDTWTASEVGDINNSNQDPVPASGGQGYVTQNFYDYTRNIASVALEARF